MSELVINQATWSDTGAPVRDLAQIQNAAGFVANVECTDEEPLQLPRCACNAGAAAEGNVSPRRDPNYGDNDPATGYGLEGLFGRATSGVGTPNGGEDLNSETYQDEDATEMERRRRRLRADLGLDAADVKPIPGFPTRSSLAD